MIFWIRIVAFTSIDFIHIWIWVKQIYPDHNLGKNKLFKCRPSQNHISND